MNEKIQWRICLKWVTEKIIRTREEKYYEKCHVDDSTRVTISSSDEREQKSDKDVFISVTWNVIRHADEIESEE